MIRYRPETVCPSILAVLSPIQSSTVLSLFTDIRIYFPLTLLPDTFDQPTLQISADGQTASDTVYNMTDRGITWPGESKKYANTRYEIGQAVPPPFWLQRYPNGYTAETPFPDLSQDEHFQVWMRTAGLPTFRKLYYRNDNSDMAAGRYQIDVYESGS